MSLVGKGIVYDTGGLSIKGKEFMPTMKRDMGGAAAVLGAFQVSIACPVFARIPFPRSDASPSLPAFHPQDRMLPRLCPHSQHRVYRASPSLHTFLSSGARL